MKTLTVFLILLFLNFFQNSHVEGLVVDKDGNPIAGIEIVVADESKFEKVKNGHAMIILPSTYEKFLSKMQKMADQRTFSDKNGKFRIPNAGSEYIFYHESYETAALSIGKFGTIKPEDFVTMVLYEKGLATYKRGKYEGTMKGDKPHGKGTMYFYDGSVYYGDWSNGNMNGVGAMDFVHNRSYQFNSGSRYVGQWKSNVVEGMGTLYMDKGSTANGKWLSGYFEKNFIDYYGLQAEGEWSGNYAKTRTTKTYNGGPAGKTSFNDILEGINQIGTALSDSPTQLAASPPNRNTMDVNSADRNKSTLELLNEALSALSLPFQNEGYSSVLNSQFQNTEPSSSSPNSTSSQAGTGVDCERDPKLLEYFEKDCQACYLCAGLALELCAYRATSDPKYMEQAKYYPAEILKLGNMCPELRALVK